MGNLQDQLANQDEKTSQSIASAQNAAIRHAEVVAQNLKKNIDQQTADQQTALNAQFADVKSAASDYLEQDQVAP